MSTNRVGLDDVLEPGRDRPDESVRSMRRAQRQVERNELSQPPLISNQGQQRLALKVPRHQPTDEHWNGCAHSKVVSPSLEYWLHAG